MDGIDFYIWQRRIHHGVRYQKSRVPFPESVEVGLDFNAALDRKEKLDPSLLTNAVMLDVCDFAKTVTKSETYFLFEMLEFNFDLGVDVDDDWQCYDYARRTNNKVKLLKDQIKMKPRRWKEKFPLPDLSNIMASDASEQSGRYYPKRNKMVDSSLLTEGSKNSQSAEYQTTQSNGTASMIKTLKGLRFTGGSYPYCKDLGVTLDVRPGDAAKEKLHPNLVTNGVMLEMLDFSRVLCGTLPGIVHDIIKQNFGLELDKMLFRSQLSKLMDRKYTCITTEDRDAFRRETFRVQNKKPGQKRKKRKALDADHKDLERLTMESKRRETLELKEVDADMWKDSDLSYMCPVDFDTEMQLDSEAAPEKMVFESCLSETKFSLDVKQEEEEVFVSPVQPQTYDFNPRLPSVRPENTTLTSKVSDLFIEDKNEDTDVKTQKQKLWTRRAPRSRQILKSSKVNDMFARCRETGLDFNVGSGNKQNLDQQLFTNYMLWEVYKFSTAMTKSLRSFLFDILDTNFNLVIQDDLHERNFFYYLITKEKNLQNHPDRGTMEFLKSPFQFPEVYNMVDVTSDFQTGQEVETQQNHLHPSEQTDMEPQPFCKQIGLNLWSTEQRPVSQKLDLMVLTTGAVLEVFVFVRELCGSVRGIVNDLLEHNFDLDLQSGETMAAQVIQRWYATQKTFMKRQTTSPKVVSWLNMVVPLNGHTKLDPQPPTAEDSGDVKPKMQDLNGDMEKKFISYRICAEIGLDLNVRSKPEAKTKLDLRVLTRGVLFEMHQYVEQNCNRYVPALYEILEYNFDLSSQNHRKVEFAWSFASQVVAIASKNGRKGDYLNKGVELPVEVSESSQVVCKEEPEDVFGELDLHDNNDLVFVRELKPVDIEVMID